ncbi:uncharacterized protein LOC141661124 [Apium graveolens]|uniref:uncharacterized protein LOC141661124 n=1 Tax=Apium graveolens TaxID=4045 RepID=UPI003D793E2D
MQVLHQTLVTDQQLRKIIHKPYASGRLVNWAIELSQFNINFVPRTAIKAQALAEFVMECTFPEPQPPAPSGIDCEESNPGTGSWKLYVDGSSTVERSRDGLIPISPEGFTIEQAITFAFKTMNNQAEYEALLSGLRLAKSLGITKMIIYSDSQIVVKQTSGEYIAKDPKLAQYQAMVWDILETIPDTTILQINREENSKADELSKLVQSMSDLTSSTRRKQTIISERFMKASAEITWQPKLWPTKLSGKDTTGPQSTPTPSPMSRNTLNAKNSAMFPGEGPPASVSAIYYPICRLGHRYHGPISPAKGDLRYVLVAIDYMTKWAEAKIRNSGSSGLRQWAAVRRVHFEAYLRELGIKHKRASVAHPQGNGQVEVTNRIILRGLEKRLEESKKLGQMSSGKSCGPTGPPLGRELMRPPFKLAYGTEARIPIETGSPSHRVINFDEISKIEGLKTNLELLDEVRDWAVKKMEDYKEKTKLYFVKKAKIREYETGDLVLRHTEASDPTNQGKLQPNWEGPQGPTS